MNRVRGEGILGPLETLITSSRGSFYLCTRSKMAFRFVSVHLPNIMKGLKFQSKIVFYFIGLGDDRECIERDIGVKRK